jgi:hypothetical protein
MSLFISPPFLSLEGAKIPSTILGRMSFPKQALTRGHIYGMLMLEPQDAEVRRGIMRITIHLPEDIHQRVAVDALKKRRNSKEAVITEILRAHYGGGQPQEKRQELLKWHISDTAASRIQAIRHLTKVSWT